MEEEYSADNIRVDSPVEAVRRRPKLYFETCFQAGNLNSLPLELACHAIDEVFDKNCTLIEFTLFKDHFSIRYDAGMSLRKRGNKPWAESIMTEIYACRNHKKHLSVGEEFCELGIATINFASEFCKIKTIFNGKIGTFEFEFGEIVHSNVEPTEITVNSTEIMLKPDPLLFENLSFTFEGVKVKVDALRERLNGVRLVLSQ